MENILLYLTIVGDEDVSDRRKVVAGAWVLSYCQSGKWAGILTLQSIGTLWVYSWGWMAHGYGQC